MIRPRYEIAPPGRGKAVYLECVELCQLAGLELDDWQDYALERILRTSGREKQWVASEAGLVVPRQNGKGTILEALELSSLFSAIAPIGLTIHSAHQFDTSLEALNRIEALVDGCPKLRKRIKPPARSKELASRSHGMEGLRTTDGRRLNFRTRTKGGGRGFSCGRLILDEAMILPESTFGAVLFTLSAQPRPQVVYTGSAVDQLVHDHGIVLSRLRKRALEGQERIAYLEWGAEAEIDDLPKVIDDREQWTKANPASGRRIRHEQIATERGATDARTFGVERLGVGDWPPTDVEDKSAIDFDRWLALVDDDSAMVDPVVLAFDVTPDRSRATISAAGRRPQDGRFHVEVAHAQRGTGWLPERLARMIERNAPEAVIYDPASPASSLVRPIEELGIELEKVTAQEYGAACGLIFDLIEQAGLRHLGQHELNAAVRNASKRPLGEAWAWSRRLSAGDISPLVACTIALWRAHTSSESVYESRGLVAI